MLHHNHTCTHVLTSLLDFLRAHRGRTFTEEDLCQQFDCSPVQTRIALNILLHEALIQKERSVGGSDRYTWGATQTDGAAQQHGPA